MVAVISTVHSKISDITIKTHFNTIPWICINVDNGSSVVNCEKYWVL